MLPYQIAELPSAHSTGQLCHHGSLRAPPKLNDGAICAHTGVSPREAHALLCGYLKTHASWMSCYMWALAPSPASACLLPPQVASSPP